MSRTARVSLEFAGREYDFALRIKELEELQELCDAGPPVILQRLGGVSEAGAFSLGQSWRIADVRETIRLGLIGGGLHVHKARSLVARYVDDRPDWFENAKIAFGILVAALMGAEDEPDVGESEGEAAKSDSPNSQTESGGSPTSTAPAAPSDKTSARTASGTSSASSKAGTAPKATSRKPKPRRTSASSA